VTTAGPAPSPGIDRDKLVREFERAWREGGEARLLEKYLAGLPAAARRDLLPDLIPIDLEYRWCKPGPAPAGVLPARPKVEDYLKLFPELGTADTVAPDLIAAEYLVRTWAGDAPLIDAYAARFRRQAGPVREALTQIEADLADERARGERFAKEADAPTDVRTRGEPIVASAALLDLLGQHHFLRAWQLDELSREKAVARFPHAHALAQHLLERDWATPFQLNLMLQGRVQSLILGSYLLMGRLGEGGMGRVYKARHQHLDRVAALKVFRKELLVDLDAEAISRFYQEVEAVGRLSHPHVIHAYDAGPVGPTHFLAMEYLESIDLGRLVKQSGPLPVDQACDYIRQAALGLQHAHERGLVHRDLKPSNLLAALPGPNRVLPPGASSWGLVKVLDLGLARLHLASRRSGHHLTMVGDVMGTPDYMAPEQADDPHLADSRADLYSLGCTFYHLLTGRVPFPGGTFLQKVNRHRGEEPTPLPQLRPELPAGVVAIVRRLMAKQPDARFQHAAHVATVLTSTLNGETISDLETQSLSTVISRPVETKLERGKLPKSERSRIWLLILGAASIPVVLIAGFVILLISHSKPPRTVPPDPSVKTTAEPGKVITNSIGMKLTLIPAGKFLMGSPETEAGRRVDEGPVHEVTISRPFYMGIHEVTQQQYEGVMGDNPAHFKKSNGGGPDNPVECVNWSDAVAFCRRLSEQPAEKSAGRSYRLPTEAEWEYACRAGTQTPYSFSNPALFDRHAWFVGNSGAKTHPVGQREPNPWGLYDMYGNVWEWCSDYHAPYKEGSAVDPRGATTGTHHIFRGGAWNDAASDSRSAHRFNFGVANGQFNIGFRVVCEVRGR
jgi:serine/threonine-protein kinase